MSAKNPYHNPKDWKCDSCQQTWLKLVVPKQGDLKKFCLVCFTFILAFSPVANEEEKEEEHEKNFKNRLSFALRVQRELADKEPYSITFISKSHDEKFAMWLEHFTYNNFFSQSRGEKTSPEQKCEYCGTEKDLIPDNSLTNHTICWNCYDKTIVEQIIAGNKEKGKKSVRIFFCRNCEKTIDTDKSYAEIRPDWKCNCAEPILVRGIRSY